MRRWKPLYAYCPHCHQLVAVSGWRENDHWLLIPHPNGEGDCPGSRKPVEGRTFTPYRPRA